QDNSRVSVTVQDNGYGIELSEYENIFKQFYRGNNTHEEEGVGLGLALCAAIAKIHAAEINLESEVNKGSVFEITFPKKGG
ncbi:MAG TPA: HAMP domain-containing histidine kinase, partial [Helicobacteraceae bacterium]|nr:HAMP domain-containing histidine kinase [Helicobacteraceae bacterium]